MEEKIIKRQYDVTDFLNDKAKLEEQIKELKEEREELENRIEEMEERYTKFINNFLFKDSDIKAIIDFSE